MALAALQPSHDDAGAGALRRMVNYDPGGLPRVLILGDHFGYPENMVHGVTMYFLRTLPTLAANGVPLSLCFLRAPHEASTPLAKRGIPIKFLSAAKWDPLVAFQVARIIRENRCNIVHAAGVKATLIARIAGRLTGCKVIVHAHDLLYPGRVVRVMHQIFSRPTDVGIGVSEAVREVLANGYYIDPAQTRVIHNGLLPSASDNDRPPPRADIRAELAIPSHITVIAMIARMHPIKGHAAMIRIMDDVVRQRSDAILILAGDGPERSTCEAMVRERGLDRHVRFLGPRNDVPDLLAACDVVVAPSKSEGLPTVAIEACAAGRPVVGFDAGGLRDIITDHISGRLIAPGDERGFADALIDLIADPDRRTALGRQALLRAPSFTVDSHVGQLLRCYAELTTPPGAIPAGQSLSADEGDLHERTAHA